LHAKALEEALIDGVQEILILMEIGDGGGGVLDGLIKVFEVFAKIVAAKRAGIEGGDDLLNLLRNDVAGDEIGDGKDLAENALGKNVLDDHLLDGGHGDVGIQRTPAKGAKVLKRGDELLVGLALGLDELAQLRAEFGDAVLEFFHGLFPFGNGGRGKLKEEGKDFNEVVRLGQVGLVKTLAILKQHGLVRLPEEDVVFGIADGKFIFDLLFQVIIGILGFPQ